MCVKHFSALVSPFYIGENRMSETRELLEPKFLVIECDSTWTGACSYILTSCKAKTKVSKACSAAARGLKREEEQTIEFSKLTLKEFIENSGILEEIIDGDRDGFDDVDPEQLTITNIFLPENTALIYQILEELFDTGYENGIISDYVGCDDVPVLMAS
jgi:hypothetical protein